MLGRLPGHPGQGFPARAWADLRRNGHGSPVKALERSYSCGVTGMVSEDCLPCPCLVSCKEGEGTRVLSRLQATDSALFCLICVSILWSVRPVSVILGVEMFSTWAETWGAVEVMSMRPW